ncbi:CHAT domain-containing protein [Microcoleus sp. FACHB-672]|nr:CHAT domain-containing protein [Microcoleus sp. FACHB-672]
MGVVFATTYSIPINAQSRIRIVSQVPATEHSATTETKEPVQAFAGQLAVFMGHEDHVTSAVFSPNKKQILTIDVDSTVRLWDTQGNLLTQFEADQKETSSLAAAPEATFSPDGSQILTTTEDKTARLWDTQGNLLAEFRGHQNDVRKAVFSPNGKQILTIGNFGDKAGIWDKFHVWDTKGNLLVELQGHKVVRNGAFQGRAAFSPDASKILTVGSDQTARLWDIKGKLLKEFQEHKIIRAVFSPDSRQILTNSDDKIVRLWDTKGNLLTEFQEAGVANAIFSPDGRQILTVSNGTARLWETKGNLLTVFGQHGDSDWSNIWIATGFSPDGRQILTSSRDGTAQIWDTKGNLLAKLRGHNDLVQAVFSPDGRQILTFSWDKVARLWDVSAAIAAESEQMAGVQTIQESVSKNNAQLAIFGGHNGDVIAVFSPDGRQILTASDDRNARLWDTNGNLLVQFQVHEGVSRAIFSPDGRQILTIGGDYNTTRFDRTTRLWDLKGNLLAVLRGSESLIIGSAKFSPDGRQILTAGINGGGDNTARLWDLKGNLLAELRPPEEVWGGVAKSAVFSPDGKQILTASNDKTARLWDLKGNLLTEFRGHLKGVNSAVFSPDGGHILTASDDETARLWDLKGNLVTEFRGHRERLKSAIFSPDGSQILTKSLDETARLWDSKGNFVAEFRADETYLGSVIFSPNGSQILITSSENTGPGIARLWDLKGNLLAVFRGHELGINSAVFSPDGRHILTASGDGTARLWDVSVAMAAQAKQTAALQTFQDNLSKNNAQLAALRDDKDQIRRAIFSPDGRQILTIGHYPSATARLWDTHGNLVAQLAGQEYVQSAEFSPDSRQILVATDSSVRLWDTKGNLLIEFQEKGHRIQSAVFSPDGRQVLTAGLESTARLWNLTGNVLTVFRGHDSAVDSAVFSPDGSQILTSSLDKTARLWDTQGNLLQEFRGHEWVDNAIFTPDGLQILTLGNDLHGYARLWDTKGNLLAEFRGQKDVYQGSSHDSHVEFTPDGQQILITSGDRLSRLWDIKGNLLAILRDHDSAVNSAVFSPDGSQILTASEDKTARLWDNKGNLLAIFRGHEDGVRSAEFSPDSWQILTASNDRTARIWDIAAGIKVSAAEVAFIKGNQLSNQETIESRQLALTQLEEALTLYRAEQNAAQAALTLLSMGKIHADLGQFQSALDSYNQALPLSQQAGSKKEEADILNSLGQLYTELAEPKAALDYYNQALPLFYQLNDQKAVAATLNNIGSIQATSQPWQNALKSYNRALVISRPAGTLDAEASALMGIGNVYITSQNWTTALNAYNQALLISQHLNDRIKETTILNQMGKIYAALGQESAAIESYNQALSLSRQLGYKTEEANILYNQAILSRQQNHLTVAKTEIETAINIIENLRTQIASQELRQSYFAGNQDYYQFYIDLLMQLHQQDPTKGYDAEALHISERARARSLLELLTEATADIRAGVDPQLLEQEQSLQQKLNALDHQKYQLVSGSYTQTELEEIQQKIASMLAQLDQLKAKIRVTNPRYAELKYPEPLKLSEIQQQVLDENTVLLEYSLGANRSYLWAVTNNSITSYELPKQNEIETLVKTFRDSVTQNSVAKLDAGVPLSQILLGPAANQLGNKRLLIVGDGALQYIPFAALPIPSNPTTPLLVQNEIVTLPSASTIAIQRRQLENRPLAAKTLAVLADPVFNLNDERVAGTPAQTPDTSRNYALTRAARNLGIGESGVILDRLKYTRTEAEKILALVPASQRLQALDFSASRSFATDPNLAQYQIIHLATHGLLDPVNPELSGVVLSLINEQGKVQDGFLRLHDIFNLNLPAELVVLSACQTGLGEEVKGEGLVGLTRGLMYAGARRVVVSLWSVNDVATSELMTRFYQKMLQDGQKPVTALRDAQLEMWNSGQWQSPYYWAAFTVQGDWR